MKKKRDIDRTVAVLLGLKEKDVSRITGAFFNEVKRLLIEEQDVNVSGFGVMRLRLQNFNGEVVLTGGTFTKGGRRQSTTIVVRGRYRVYFSQSRSFRNTIKERQTEKNHEPAQRRRGNGQVRGRRDG